MDLEAKRLKLHEFLCEILGSRNCYYSPPTGMKMNYPCIVYKLGGNRPFYADNIQYLLKLQWDVIIIDNNPDTKIINKMFEVPECRFDRSMVSDGLNHFYHTLYY